MAEDKNKNKEGLQNQSEHNAAGQAQNKKQQDGDQIHLDPAKKSLQADDTKVQNPNRNLAQGGNNRPYDK